MIHEDRKKKIDSAIDGKIGMELDSWALVNESWQENLSVYRNITLDDTAINFLYVETWIYGAFLTGRKSRKYLTEAESDYFTNRLAGSIGAIQGLIDGWTDEKKEQVAESFKPFIEDRRDGYINGDPMAFFYERLLNSSAVGGLGEEIIQHFVKFKTDGYTELQLHGELEDLAPRS
jgi:hypothetical protein